MSKGRRRFEADARSPIAKGKIGRMIELERSSKFEPRAWIDHLLSVAMRLGKRRRNVYACARSPCGANCSDGRRFLVRRSADDDFFTYSEGFRIANLDIRRSGARIRREIRVVCASAYARDCNGFNTVVNTVDVEPDLVANGNIIERRHFDVGCAGRRICRQVGLRALLANSGDRGHLIAFRVSPNDGITSAIAERNLLAHLETRSTRDRYIRRSGRNRDHGAFRKWLPQRRTVARGRAEACDLTSLYAGAGIDAYRIAGRHAGRTSDIDSGVAFAPRHRQARVGETEQIKTARLELRSSGNLDH